eukprot:COSAG02_NODE_4631_length_5145_cov_1.964130_2_plen_35_part_00
MLICVSESTSVTDANNKHPKKALLPICVTEAGIY